MSKSFVEYLEMQCEPKKIRTEEEILKDFEELGYRIISNLYFRLVLRKANGTTISIYKEDDITIAKGYRKYDYHEDFLALNITLQEHKLLHELFLCWAWI